MKIAKIRAQVVYDGKAWQCVHEIIDDLPSAAIGRCVSNAVHMAWKDGVDPTKGIVIVTFN